MLDEPNCYKRRCKHFIGVEGGCTEDHEYFVCEAFPEGIPDQIAYGRNKHLKVFKGQANEIVYEKVEGK